MQSLTYVEEWCSKLDEALEEDDVPGITYLLIEVSSDPNAQETGEIDLSPLSFAVFTGESAILKMVYTALSRVRWMSPGSLDRELRRVNCSFPHVAHTGNISLAETWLRSGSDVNERAKGGNTALHLAVASNDREMAISLLDHGADLHCTNDIGERPLNLLFRTMDIDHEFLRLLLSRGACVNTMTPEDHSLLHVAACGCELGLFRIMVEEGGGDPSACCNIGRNCLHYSAFNRNHGVLEYIVKLGLDLESVDIWGNTPLLIASWYKNLYAAMQLLRYKANPNVTNDFGNTPLHFLLNSPCCPEMARILFERGVDLTESHVLVKAYWLHSCWTESLVVEMARLEILGTTISPRNLLVIRNCEKLDKLLRQCRKELLLMKTVYVYERVSFFTICTASVQELARLAKNRDLTSNFEVRLTSIRDWHYYDWIKDRFSDEIKKRRLHEAAWIPVERFLGLTLIKCKSNNNWLVDYNTYG